MKNKELIKKLDKECCFIVRNDGVLLRDFLGNYRLVNNHPEYINFELNKLHQKCKELKCKYTYKCLTVEEYKLINTNFKF